MQKGSVGRSVAVDSIAGSAIQQGPNFFLFLLSQLSLTLPSPSSDQWGSKKGGWIHSRKVYQELAAVQEMRWREGEGSAAAARTIDGTLACRVTISAFARYLSLTFEVVEDLVGLVLAGVGEGV